MMFRAIFTALSALMGVAALILLIITYLLIKSPEALHMVGLLPNAAEFPYEFQYELQRLKTLFISIGCFAVMFLLVALKAACGHTDLIYRHAPEDGKVQKV